MRAATRFAMALSMSVMLAGQSAPALAAQAYEGFWASTKKDCRDEDSANRMSIEGGNRLYCTRPGAAPARSLPTGSSPGK